MKNRSKFLLPVLFAVMILTYCTSPSKPKSETEQDQLLALLRPQIEKELGIEITFEVRTLNISGNWAFGDVVPRQKNGAAIDYTKTQLDPDLLEAFDDWVCALWQKDDTGVWTLRTAILGATDVPYGCWWKEFGAPKEVLPYAEENCEYE